MGPRGAPPSGLDECTWAVGYLCPQANVVPPTQLMQASVGLISCISCLPP